MSDVDAPPDAAASVSAASGSSIPELIRRIYVCGYPYEVIPSDHPLDIRDEMIGFIQYRELRITIRNGVHAVMQKESLLHEMLHAIDGAIGVNDRVDERENVNRSALLFAMLRDPRNRPAWDWIRDAEGE